MFFIFFSNFNFAQRIDQVKTENTFHSEIIKNSFFDDVIEITDKNVFTYGINYFFNISISKLKDAKAPILFIQTKVPLNLLPSIYPEFTKLIVIVPNWTYYKETSNRKFPKGVLCGEPIASSIVYEFNRENGKIFKDSLIIMGGKGFPEMKMKKKTNLNENEIEFFYKESYGSVCCPRDPQNDNKPTREEFINLFENKNNVKLNNNIYKKIKGKEGEKEYYYSSTILTNEQKLKFILERDDSRVINRHLKDLQRKRAIFTPFIELNNNLEKL